MMMFVKQVAPGEDTGRLGVTLLTPTRTPWLKPRPGSRSCRWRLTPWRKLIETTSRGQCTPLSLSCCPKELDPHKQLIPCSTLTLLSENTSPTLLTAVHPKDQRPHTHYCLHKLQEWLLLHYVRKQYQPRDRKWFS